MMSRPTRPGSPSKQHGFTLVEILIYMGLFTIFLLILSGIFVSTLEIQQNTHDTARVEEDSHFLYARLQYDILRADEVQKPSVSGESSDTLTLLSDGKVLSYQLINDQLTLSVDSGPPQLLTGPEITVTKLEFIKLGKEDEHPSIKANLTLQSSTQNTSVPETRELSYTFGTR